MTRIILSTAAAIALAAPSFAQTATETAVEHFNESKSGNDVILLETGSGISADAAEIHAGIAARSNSGNSATDPTAAELLDGNDGVVNQRAARILNDLAEEEGSGVAD